MSSSSQLTITTAALVVCFSGQVAAQEAAMSADATGATAPPATSSTEAAPRPHDPIELGMYGGLMVLSGQTDAAAGRGGRLQETEFGAVGFDWGFRLGLYPVRYLGLEGEGGWVQTRSSNEVGANVGTGRFHLVGQYPLGAVTPFVVVGGGALGGDCRPGGCEGVLKGRDVDAQFHFGAGIKLQIVDHVYGRLDVRDNIVEGEHLPDVLLGLSYTLGRRRPPPPPPPPADSDGDGLVDSADACPQEPAATPDGCPIKDRDGDGKADDVDKCPDRPSELPDGCPDPDPDKDGVLVDADKCPDVAGIAPDGCPDPDFDRDGIKNEDDKCPNEAESKNGFEDADGCPDEVPEAVKKFTGVIQGIEFDFGKATIRPVSFKVLDGTVAVLKEHPSLKLRISGHTDNVGSAERNSQLSKERAQAVADYFVSKGVEKERLQTEGFGPDKPIADNATAAGRQKNRRIEFAIIE